MQSSKQIAFNLLKFNSEERDHLQSSDEALDESGNHHEHFVYTVGKQGRWNYIQHIDIHKAIPDSSSHELIVAASVLYQYLLTKERAAKAKLVIDNQDSDRLKAVVTRDFSDYFDNCYESALADVRKHLRELMLTRGFEFTTGDEIPAVHKPVNATAEDEALLQRYKYPNSSSVNLFLEINYFNTTHGMLELTIAMCLLDEKDTSHIGLNRQKEASRIGYLRSLSKARAAFFDDPPGIDDKHELRPIAEHLKEADSRLHSALLQTRSRFYKTILKALMIDEYILDKIISVDIISIPAIRAKVIGDLLNNHAELKKAALRSHACCDFITQFKFDELEGEFAKLFKDYRKTNMQAYNEIIAHLRENHEKLNLIINYEHILEAILVKLKQHNYVVNGHPVIIDGKSFSRSAAAVYQKSKNALAIADDKKTQSFYLDVFQEIRAELGSKDKPAAGWFYSNFGARDGTTATLYSSILEMLVKPSGEVKSSPSLKNK